MEKHPSFLDKQTLIALAVIFIVWMGWERHMRKKYPPSTRPPSQSFQKPLGNKESAEKPQVFKTKTLPQEKLFTFEDSEWKVTLSSHGGGVKNVYLKNHLDLEKQNVRFVSGRESFFQPFFDKNILDFNLKKTTPSKLEGVTWKQGQKIQMEIQVFSYFLEYQFKFNPEGLSSFEVQTTVLPSKKDSNGFFKNLFTGGRKHLSFFAKDFNKTHKAFYSKEKPTQMDFKEMVVTGMGTRYFGQGFVNESSLIPQMKFKGQTHEWQTQIIYIFSKNTQVSNIKYRIFFGPKSYSLLTQVHPELHEWVNFGFLRGFAEVILWFLSVIFSWVHNWGVAIILMTIVIRVFLLPLNLFSYKSMQAMKKLQPEIKKIRESHKKDMRKMNMEIMELMKQKKVRPFASYIPLLIQLPIFFALYRVLSESFELYQAPFFGWIQDLSSKDPFFILPVLMGGAMYLQQKITPTNLEPAQEKVLRFLPILFTFFMLGLPSGLTLYIFVSTLFGLLQQVYLDKTFKPS